MHPETRHGANQHTKWSAQVEQSSKTFVINTARKTRKGRSTIQKAATRGKKVKVLADITGTSLDKGSELDALAKLPEAEQRELAGRAKAGENVSARRCRTSARPVLVPDQKKDAGGFHIELMEWTDEFCTRVLQWHAAQALMNEENKFCIMQALEMSAMRLQRTSQAIDDR